MAQPSRSAGGDSMLQRIRGEFADFPGLRLTPQQAARLWGLDAATCQSLLEALVDSRFLYRTSTGLYRRLEKSSGSANKT